LVGFLPIAQFEVNCGKNGSEYVKNTKYMNKYINTKTHLLLYDYMHVCVRTQGSSHQRVFKIYGETCWGFNSSVYLFLFFLLFFLWTVHRKKAQIKANNLRALNN